MNRKMTLPLERKGIFSFIAEEFTDMIRSMKTFKHDAYELLWSLRTTTTIAVLASGHKRWSRASMGPAERLLLLTEFVRRCSDCLLQLKRARSRNGC